MPISDLFPDVGKCKKGTNLPLSKVAGCKPGDFILVKWAHSDDCRRAIDQIERDMVEAFGEGEKPDPDMVQLDARVSMVADWGGPTFEGDKATKTNIKKLLKARPDIAAMVERTAEDTKLFFSKNGKSS